jgi:hypothetical protein
MSTLGERTSDFDWRLISTGDGRPIQRRQMSPEDIRLTMRALAAFNGLSAEAKLSVTSILLKRMAAKNADA